MQFTIVNQYTRSSSLRRTTLQGMSDAESTEEGKQLLREYANTVKRSSMELGGKAHFVVFDDAL